MSCPTRNLSPTRNAPSRLLSMADDGSQHWMTGRRANESPFFTPDDSHPGSFLSSTVDEQIIHVELPPQVWQLGSVATTNTNETEIVDAPDVPGSPLLPTGIPTGIPSFLLSALEDDISPRTRRTSIITDYALPDSDDDDNANVVPWGPGTEAPSSDWSPIPVGNAGSEGVLETDIADLFSNLEFLDLPHSSPDVMVLTLPDIAETMESSWPPYHGAPASSASPDQMLAAFLTEFRDQAKSCFPGITDSDLCDTVINSDARAMGAKEWHDHMIQELGLQDSNSFMNAMDKSLN